MLRETLGEAARRFGDAPAFVADAGWSLSYTELDLVSDEAAAGLVRRGVRRGDVVALVLPAIPEYPVAYLAAAKIGAITAGVNPRLTSAERANVLATAQPALILATDDLAPPDGRIEVVTPAEHPGGLLTTVRVPASVPPAAADPDDHPVALVFTSGTTGLPRGAVFCNRQLRVITGVDVGDAWGGGGPTMAATALAHLGFMTKLAGNLRKGGTQFLRLRWRADDALRLSAEHRMATVGGIPTQVALMLRSPLVDTLDLSGVRGVVMGGGPATPALVREARERLHAPVVIRYSCTEAGVGVGTSLADPPADAEGTVGRPLTGVELVVLDDEDEPVVPGEVGSVCLRSGAVMTGYWRDPDATAAAFTADGFVRTGDLGFVDDRGRLHLVGRSKEMYVRGGFNVYPFEVEQVLAGHPDVAAVTVVPRGDPVMGEVGVAVVVGRPGGARPTLEGLRAYGSSYLADYKLPEDLVLVDDLPLTPMDKVDRTALAALVAAGAATASPSADG